MSEFDFSDAVNPFASQSPEFDFSDAVNPFIQESKPSPDEVNDQINAAMAERQAVNDRGFINNAVRGAGERAADLGGGLLNAAGAAAESAPKGGMAPGYVGQFVTPEQDAKAKESIANTFAEAADSARAVDLGYDEQRNTLDGAKAKFDKGDYLGSAFELWSAGNETMLTSAPDMVGAAGALPVYVAARTGEIANERAKNKGLDRPTQTEMNEAAPFAVASSLLERILPGRLIRGVGTVTDEAAKEISDQAIKHVLKTVGKEAGKDAAIEGGTEFIQEGVIEYIGQRYGTEASMDVREALAQGTEAAILGSIGGGTAGTARGAVDAATDILQGGKATPEPAQSPIEPGSSESPQPVADTAQPVTPQPDLTAPPAEQKPSILNQSPDELEQSLSADPDLAELDVIMQELDGVEAEAIQLRSIIDDMPQQGSAIEAPVMDDPAPIVPEEQPTNIFDQFDSAPVEPQPVIDPEPVAPTVAPTQEIAQEITRQEQLGVTPVDLPSAPIDQPANDVDVAASEAATSQLNDLPEPTEAQKESGNYKKGHVKIQGLDISIENPRGSTRSGTDPDGKKWEVAMKSHYGYIRKTEGADGEHVDVFIGPNPESQKVFVIDQVNRDGTFDEHKVMMAFDSKLKARSGYKANYTNGWKVGPITSMTMDEFKVWVKDGDTKKPLKSDQFAGVGKMVETPEALSKTLEEQSDTQRMPAEEIKAELEQLSAIANQRAQEEFDRNHGMRPPVPKSGFEYLTAEERARMHELKQSLPTYGEEREAAKARVKQRVASRKRGSSVQADTPASPEIKSQTHTRKNVPLKQSKAAEIIGAGIGDQVVLNGDFDYLTGGEPYEITSIDADGQVYFRNPKTGAGTFVSLWSLNNAAARKGLKFERLAKPAPKEKPGNQPTSSLPEILSETKSKVLKRMAAAKGIKKGSPGYADAMARLEDEYETEVDRAQASLPFDEFNKLNSDTPESINRQAYNALREEFDLPLFSLGGDSGSTTGSDSAVSAMEANKVIRGITSKWITRGTEVELRDSFSALPVVIKESAKKNNIGEGDVKGVFHKGITYLVRENLKTPLDVEKALFHEAYGHYGLRLLFGQDTRNKMSRLFFAVGGLKGVKQLADKFSIDLSKYQRKLADIDSTTANSILVEELLAHIAEQRNSAERNWDRAKRWAKELIGAIRNWLRAHGFNRLSEASETDLFFLLRQARKAVVGTHGQVAGDDIRFMVGEVGIPPAKTRKIIGDDPVLAAWTVLSQNDDAFQLPISQKQSLREIFAELEPDIKIRRAPEFDTDGAKVWAINPDKSTLALVFEKGKSVWIDVADYSDGQGGKVIYNAVANYAHNTNKTFVGDPAGLSDKAMARRLENMISSALKFGTTKHLWPHERQEQGGAGVPAIKWKDGDDVHNLREMINASYQATLNQFPEIRDLRYNPKTDQIEGAKDGKVYTPAAIKKIAESKRAEGAEGRPPVTAGRKTLERAILTHTVSRGTRQAQFDVLAGLSNQPSQRLSSILYSLRRPESDPEPRPSAGVSVSGTQNGTFAKPDETLKGFKFKSAADTILRVWADKFRPLLNTQREIQKATGQAIPEDVNAYLAEELFHGKTENDLRKMEERYIEPLTKKMAEYKIERDELDMYLWAVHAPERNKQIAKINPAMPDGGSGMTTKQAIAVLKQAQAEGKMKNLHELAQYVYGMLKQRREIMKGATMDDAMIDAWDQVYKFYVPLKGRAIDESSDKFPRAGKGFDIRGKETLRALGRRTKPESPVLHSIRDTTDTIIRYRKNEVGNVFLGLVQKYPNPDYWNVYTSESPELQPKLKTKDGIEFVGEGAVVNKNKYFITKKNGKEYFIDLKDEKLLRAMQNMGPEPLNMFMQLMGIASRFLSSMNTTYNPEFTITNFARDIQTAVINMLAEQDLHDGKAKGQEIAAKMVKGVPTAVRAIHASLTGKQLKGAAADWQKMFDQFRDDGAKTGWFDMKDINGQAKQLENLINMRKGNLKGRALRTKKAVGDFIENINGAIENGVRLSAYKAAVEAGISRKQAASLAKNLTVNFNRKGEIGQAVNSLYMFANASIQGTAAFARAIGTLKVDASGKRSLNLAQKVGIGIAASSFALALLNREMAGEDDDEENLYDKVPDYVKERNIVIMKSIVGGEPGEYWTIPLPYGYNIFNVIGTSAEAAAMGEKGVGEASANILKAFFGSFSPIGIAESDSVASGVSRTLAPTITKPFVDIAANENFFGAPVYRENLPFGAPKPESYLSKRSTPEAWKWAAEFINDATGGSEYRSGAIDVNPDKLDYVFKYLVGSSGAFVSRVADATIKTTQGRELEAREIPFVRKVTGSVSFYPDQSAFYDRKDEISQLEKEWKSLRGAERIAFYKEHGGKIRLEGRAKAVEKELKRLRGRRDAIEEDESLTGREKDSRLKLIEKQMKAKIDQFNKIWPD